MLRIIQKGDFETSIAIPARMAARARITNFG